MKKTFRLALAAVIGLGTTALNLAAAPAASAAPECGVFADGAAAEAVAAVESACEQIGVPYAWAGGHGAEPGPSRGDCNAGAGAPNDCNVIGLDCSGFVRYAYALAVGEDIINGITTTQWQSSRVVDRFMSSEGYDPLLPGDLLLYGTAPGNLHHISMYLGDGWIIEAPNSGALVRVSAASSHGDYYGAVRLFEGGTSSAPALGSQRVAYAEGGELWAKDGDLEAPPEWQASDVKKYVMEGDRVAVLKNDGSLLAKEGDLGPDWYTVDADSVTDFQLDGDRIAFTEGTDLYVVDGELDGEAVHQDAAVKAFQIEGDRVGVLTPEGELLVKEGDLGPEWETIADGGVTDFQLHGTRIAYREGTALFAQEGELDAQSVDQEVDATAYQLSGDRLAALTAAGELMVKEGDLDPGWFTVDADSVTAFHLDTDRIAFAEGGELYAKDGDLDADIVHLGSGVTGFQLDGDRIAALRGDDLEVKEGDLDADWIAVNPDSVTSFQIGADLTRPVMN
jgi:cell wall-associated NlpC family hydrolase